MLPESHASLTLPTTVLVRARNDIGSNSGSCCRKSARPALASDSSTSSFARSGFLFRPASQISKMITKMITTTTTQPLPEEELDPV